MTSDNKARDLGTKQVCAIHCTTKLPSSLALQYNSYGFTAENKTRWTQHDNDTRLDGRIGDIQSWMETLSKTLGDTEEEINKVRRTFLSPGAHEGGSWDPAITHVKYKSLHYTAALRAQGTCREGSGGQDDAAGSCTGVSVSERREGGH